MDQTGLHPPDGNPPPASSFNSRQCLQDAVARYHRPLVAYAMSRTGNLERARDAAQDTLLKLCQQSADKLEQDIQPRLAPWLFTVCRNQVIDMHRKEQHMTATDTNTLDQTHQSSATSDGPSADAEAHEQQDHLLGLVDALPGNQREVVQLRFQGGLAYREIADITGHSVSYVGVLLHDAIKHLRQQLTTLNT